MQSNADDRSRIEQAESISNLIALVASIRTGAQVQEASFADYAGGRKAVIVKINALSLYRQKVAPKNHLSISLT